MSGQQTAKTAVRVCPTPRTSRQQPTGNSGPRTIGAQVTIEKCPFPSPYRLFTPASWQPCGARSRRARLAPRGGLALGKVWEFIRSQPGLRTDGHNIFLYHHPTQPGAPILCDFGVEVTRTFETAGEVYATETQGGEAAVAVHRGPYNRMNEAHDAIGKWIAANRRESAGHSWEIYGDPTPDPADTETTVVYLLK